jgi:protein-disulfide isomerase
VTVEIYYDYMCPACGAFEAVNGDELDGLMNDGVARLELRPISFLDETSEGTRYSTRAANAFATVVDSAPDLAWDFHQALFADQPEEGTEGLSDDDIAAIASDSGVPADTVDRFTDLTFEQWVAAVTEEAFDSGVTGTPTIKINGEVFDGDPYTVGDLTETIESAAGDQ